MLHRTVFRGMSKYFKNKFSKKSKYWQRKKGKKQKVAPMRDLVSEFVAEEFEYLNTENSQISLGDLIDPLIVILHSHRYKKQEEFTKNTDFSIIRDLLYCYSSDALSRFMKNPVYPFLLHHFYKNDKIEFINSSCRGETEEFRIKLMEELE